MDEIEQFARLRPSDIEFTEEDRAVIAGTLFESTRPGKASNRLRWLSAAAAVVGLAATGAWFTISTESATVDAGERPTSTSNIDEAATSTTAQSTATSTSVGGEQAMSVEAAADTFRPPLMTVDRPDWTLEYAGFGGPDVEQRSILVDPELGLQGPVIELMTFPEGTQTGFQVETPVNLDGRRGSYVAFGETHWLGFTDDSGRQVTIHGWKVSKDDVVDAALAAIATSTSTENPLQQPIGRLVPADTDLLSAMGASATYSFGHASEGGTEINLYPGGEYTLQAKRFDPGEYEPIMINDEAAHIIDYSELYGSEGGEGRYRLSVVRDFWLWEIDAAHFSTRAEFLEFVDSIVIAESDLWYSALPDDLYGPDDLSDALTQMTSDIPLPDGLNIQSLVDQLNNGSPAWQHDDLIIATTRSIVCAWTHQLQQADANGDQTARQQAIDAILSTKSWAILNELAGSIGWSEAVWETADEVARLTSPEDTASSAITNEPFLSDGFFGCD